MKGYDRSFFDSEESEQFWNCSDPPKLECCRSLSDMMIVIIKNEVKHYMLSLVDHYLLYLDDDDYIKWLNLENVSVEMIRSPMAGDGIQLMKSQQSFQFFGDVEPWYNCLKQFCVLRNFTHFYTLTKKIGKGNFAEVFKAEHKSIQQEFAVKCFQKNQLINDDRKAIIKEISILRKIQNDSILRLYEVFESDERIFLVMELLNGGELYKYLKKSPPFSEEKCAKLIHKLLKSLQQIHNKGIIHRDLKPENLILRKKDDYLDICIADFGLADYYNPQGKYLFTRCGTPGYVAPELLQDKIYDYKVDVYSIGILMYILISGSAPFDSNDYQEIVMKNYVGLVNYEKVKLSEQGLNILKGLLHKNPLKRLSVQEALNHQWFIQEKLGKSCQFKIRRSSQLLKKLDDNHFHQSTQLSPITLLSPRYSRLNLEEALSPRNYHKMRQIRKSNINIHIK